MRLTNGLQQDRRTLLITGAAGFLGTQAVEKALSDGYRVVAVVRPRGDDGRAETRELADLRLKYRDALIIEPVNLEDPTQVHALLARHPETDAVLHAAAMLKVPLTQEGIAAAHHANVEATQYLAQACEEQAAHTGRLIQFHFVSSVNALQFERDERLLPGPESVPYASTKCNAAKWLREMQKRQLPHLDISVTYPTNLIGPVPAKGVTTILLTLAQAEEAGRPHDMQGEYARMGLLDKADRRMKLVHSENYLRDVFSCFDGPVMAGFHEYGIKADYSLKLGKLVEAIGRVIDAKRPGAASAVPDKQLELPNLGTSHAANVALRHLRYPPQAPVHAPITLHEVLAAQYDRIAQGRGRQ